MGGCGGGEWSVRGSGMMWGGVECESKQEDVGEWSVRGSRRMWGGVECERQGEDVGVEWSVRGSRGVECESQQEDVGGVECEM